MISLQTLQIFTLAWIAIAIFTFVLLLFVSAPYGRHVRQGWGPSINNKLGWILMELPSFGIMLFFALSKAHSAYVYSLFGLWLIHYFNRTFIFPFRIRTSGKQMPVLITGSAIFFNFINAGTNGYYLSSFQTTEIGFDSWQFYMGLLLWILGFLINQWSDTILINLRKGNSKEYKIPQGFLFQWVSCPNHLGEIIEWLGFAVMAWNLPALAFFIWTIANLAPRAWKHHQWYQRTFEDYPADRKSLIPNVI